MPTSRDNFEQSSTMLFAKITIVSGGQTGADRAALDFALTHGMAHGGWCPRGRLAEDGPLAPRYALRETPSRKYAERTEWNIRDSDATAVFAIERPLTGGTRLTESLAHKLGKPCLVLVQRELPLWNTSESTRQLAARLLEFLREHDAQKINIAGPRASQQPEIGVYVTSVLSAAYAQASNTLEVE